MATDAQRAIDIVDKRVSEAFSNITDAKKLAHKALSSIKVLENEDKHLNEGLKEVKAGLESTSKELAKMKSELAAEIETGFSLIRSEIKGIGRGSEKSEEDKAAEKAENGKISIDLKSLKDLKLWLAMIFFLGGGAGGSAASNYLFGSPQKIETPSPPSPKYEYLTPEVKEGKYPDSGHVAKDRRDRGLPPISDGP